jgi:hypothetical protein
VITVITDIDVFQIFNVILQVSHVIPLVGLPRTSFTRTNNVINVRQSWIEFEIRIDEQGRFASGISEGRLANTDTFFQILRGLSGCLGTFLLKIAVFTVIDDTVSIVPDIEHIATH